MLMTRKPKSSHRRQHRRFGMESLEHRIVLDSTVVLFGSGMGNANSHTNSDLPIFLAGGGAFAQDLLVSDLASNQIYFVDGTTGDRTVVSGGGVGTGPALSDVRGIGRDRPHA